MVCAYKILPLHWIYLHYVTWLHDTVWQAWPGHWFRWQTVNVSLFMNKCAHKESSNLATTALVQLTYQVNMFLSVVNTTHLLMINYLCDKPSKLCCCPAEAVMTWSWPSSNLAHFSYLFSHMICNSYSMGSHCSETWQIPPHCCHWGSQQQSRCSLAANMGAFCKDNISQWFYS